MKEEALKRVEEISRGIAEQKGLRLKRVYFMKEKFGNVLRVVIDKKDGVTVEDCAEFSKELNHILDVEDIIEGRYFLEVSSPGINRKLIDKEDFIDSVGKTIKVKLKSPINEKRVLAGRLKLVGEESFLLQVNFSSFNINFDNVQEAEIEG
jgi:ribosome maturation factor RimP